MSQKKPAPTWNYGSTSKFRTPTNLNATTMRSSNSRQNTTLRHNPNTTTVCRKHLELGSSSAPTVDYNLECDVAYNDYLQSLMIQEIAKRAIATKTQEMKDQIGIQNDVTFQIKLAIEQSKKEGSEIKKMQELEQFIDVLIDVINKTREICQDCDFEQVVEDLSTAMDEASSKIHLNNIQGICEQASYNKLFETMEESLAKILKIKSLSDVDNTNMCYGDIKKYLEARNSVSDKLSQMSAIQKTLAFNFLRNVSNVYAKNYPKN